MSLLRVPDWYKDAIFYEVHVKAFMDGNGDGIGDFSGLTARLDYLRDLGVDCLWLLPMYASPLRDDGYDIADFYTLHPSYGTVAEFRTLLDVAHARGLRVIADLVMNHTSDQHPWFQASRSSRDLALRATTTSGATPISATATRASSSSTPRSRTGPGTPAGGPTTGTASSATSPTSTTTTRRCARPCSNVMRFWLDQGLDGFRCDAVPYLFEREGTNCENLPETHAFLREFRRVIDREYGGDRVLLAEANQWPEDVRPYFGDGDEFHMAFHFPSCRACTWPSRLEERLPIVDIFTHTPAIPASCQWGLFLRNHDELTLEMVTDEEREFMYYAYARDPDMKLNLGIRRRLAPLLDNDRRRVELLNCLLLTLPGSPIIYYGDEIGMGDNICLGDRDGVRTPMQWSRERNAGFSSADEERLYLPAITDAVYGYQAMNVAAQHRTPSSLLNTMRGLIAARRTSPAFGRGAIEFLRPRNPRVIAYVEASPARGRPHRGQPGRLAPARGVGSRGLRGRHAGGDARAHPLSRGARAAVLPEPGPPWLLLVSPRALRLRRRALRPRDRPLAMPRRCRGSGCLMARAAVGGDGLHAGGHLPGGGGPTR